MEKNEINTNTNEPELPLIRDAEEKIYKKIKSKIFTNKKQINPFKTGCLIIIIFLLGKLIFNIAIWSINRVWIIPSYEGVVTDETTGKPIEKVVVSIIWRGHEGERIHFEGGAEGGYGMTIITGKDGKYKTPKRYNWPMKNSFEWLEIISTHPLFIQKDNIVYKYNRWTNKVDYSGIKLSNGTIYYDIKLVGVEEKYGKNPNIVAQFQSYLGTIENGWYWKILREHNIKFNLDETFGELLKVADEIDQYYNKLHPGEYQDYQKGLINKTKIKVLENLREVHK